MRGHAGLLPLHSDRDTQGLTLHIILFVCFPDASKTKQTKKVEYVSSEAFYQQAKWYVCLQICHQESDKRAGLQSVPPKETKEREHLPSCFNSWKVDGRCQA